MIDKPVGITSRDAVDGVQRCLPRNIKIGHTGTLDPLASGVLVLCLGHATHLAEFVQMMPKSYEAEFTFGAQRQDDAEGPITISDSIALPDRAEIQKTLPNFVGVIDQIPPAFSAAKVSGALHVPSSSARSERDADPPRPNRSYRDSRIQCAEVAAYNRLRQGDLYPIAGTRSWRQVGMRRIRICIAADTRWTVHSR